MARSWNNSLCTAAILWCGDDSSASHVQGFVDHCTTLHHQHQFQRQHLETARPTNWCYSLAIQCLSNTGYLSMASDCKFSSLFNPDVRAMYPKCQTIYFSIQFGIISKHFDFKTRYQRSSVTTITGGRSDHDRLPNGGRVLSFVSLAA